MSSEILDLPTIAITAGIAFFLLIFTVLFMYLFIANDFPSVGNTVNVKVYKLDATVLQQLITLNIITQTINTNGDTIYDPDTIKGKIIAITFKTIIMNEIESGTRFTIEKKRL